MRDNIKSKGLDITDKVPPVAGPRERSLQGVPGRFLGSTLSSLPSVQHGHVYCINQRGRSVVPISSL